MSYFSLSYEMHRDRHLVFKSPASRGLVLRTWPAEIPSLCKDQHGCRYLQKTLEEGVPGHRDMIFRKTFGHFADLMTGESARLLLFLNF